MHEMSIVQNILEIIDDTLSETDQSKLKEVVVDIGELVAVVPDSIQFCFEALIQDSVYENAKLTINNTPAIINCKACNKDSNINKYNFTCPECNSSEIILVSGEELNIRYLEVE